jgi:hypothetical protein
MTKTQFSGLRLSETDMRRCAVLSCHEYKGIIYTVQRILLLTYKTRYHNYFFHSVGRLSL